MFLKRQKISLLESTVHKHLFLSISSPFHKGEFGKKKTKNTTPRAKQQKILHLLLVKLTKRGKNVLAVNISFATLTTEFLAGLHKNIG